MKKNKSGLKILLTLTVFIILSTLIVTSISAANTMNNNKFADIIINPEFVKWEALSESEKSKVIMPQITTTTLKDSVKRSTYNQILKLGNSAVGTKYDLRTELDEIIVKNQQQTGDCWAFSSTSMIETTLAKKYNKVSEEYSPMHIEYYISNIADKVEGDGANSDFTLAYLASGKGPVYESDLPFESVYNETENSYPFYVKDKENVTLNQEVRAQLREATTFAEIYKTYDETTGEPICTDAYAEVIYTDEEMEVFRNLVKAHIQNYGGVTAGYHAPDGITLDAYLEEYNNFYNETTSAYYCYDSSLKANHQITIVGWDDTYSKSNFVTQPANDGAWIFLNSWGKDVGEDGYMYISYDDCHIENMIVGIDDLYEFSEGTSLEYDNVYEYDPLGCSIGITWPSFTSGYLANVFTREDISKEEYLTQIGMFLDVTEGVEIYINSTGEDLNTLTKVATFTGSEALEAGYHTIDITPTKLTGNKFVVAIKYINSEGVNLPFECNLSESGIAYESNPYDAAASNSGESYRSFDGEEWEDLEELQINWTQYLRETNACIKAFTTEQEPVVDTTVHVTGVTLDKNTAKVEIGSTVALTATVAPTDATNKNVTWSSSDTDVATVSGGVVTGVSEGTATITVTTEDGDYTAECVVTVEELQDTTIHVTGVTLDKNTAEVNVGSTVTLTATIAPVDATNKNVTWLSSDTDVATVSGGVVTGVSEGTATITVTTEDGDYTAECVVTVSAAQEGDTPVAVTGVTLNQDTAEIEVEETVTLTATIAPADATNKNVTWSSSDTDVATVSGGVVTGVSEGTATITVTTVEGNYTAECEVTVNEEDTTVAVTGVTLNKTSGTIKEGETLQLVATIAPANATNKNIIWSSSDTEVATVSGGVVTGVSEGTATITVTTEDGNKTAVANITVRANEETTVAVTSVSLNVSNVSLQVDGQYTLVAEINPTNATNKNVTWSSSDSSIVEVSNTGIITAKKEGTATITVTTEDGNKTDTATVTVTKKTNNDDDIYTDPEDGKEDPDTLPGDLPQTGENIIIITMIAIVLVAGIVFIVKFKRINVK